MHRLQTSRPATELAHDICEAFRALSTTRASTVETTKFNEHSWPPNSVRHTYKERRQACRHRETKETGNAGAEKPSTNAE
jgi:hypothetical protein